MGLPLKIISNPAFDQHLLNTGDGLAGIKALGAGAGAIHDGMAAVEPERVFELVETFAGVFVAAVDHAGNAMSRTCCSNPKPFSRR